METTTTTTPQPPLPDSLQRLLDLLEEQAAQATAKMETGGIEEVTAAAQAIGRLQGASMAAAVQRGGKQ